MSMELCLRISFVGKDTTLDCAAFILLGGAITAYSIVAKTFIESSKIHVLTPTNKLERYVPRWYHRLLLFSVGLAGVLGGIVALLRR